MIKIYEKIDLKVIPISEAVETNFCGEEAERGVDIETILEMLSEYELSDQVFMICNMLTMSGFTQKEIAKALNVPYWKYRKKLFEIRKFIQNKKETYL